MWEHIIAGFRESREIKRDWGSRWFTIDRPFLKTRFGGQKTVGISLTISVFHAVVTSRPRCISDAYQGRDVTNTRHDVMKDASLPAKSTFRTGRLLLLRRPAADEHGLVGAAHANAHGCGPRNKRRSHTHVLEVHVLVSCTLLTQL